MDESVILEKAVVEAAKTFVGLREAVNDAGTYEVYWELMVPAWDAEDALAEAVKGLEAAGGN